MTLKDLVNKIFPNQKGKEMNKIIYIFFIMFFVCSCSTKYYTYSANNFIINESQDKFKGKTIDFWGYNKNEPSFNDSLFAIFSKFGFKRFVKKQGKWPDYLGAYRYKVNVYQGYKNVPVWGQTGINSINTDTYGSIYPGLNRGSYNYTGYSTSRVNYDYGITGYQTVPYTSYDTSLELFIFEPKSKDLIYRADMYINDAVDLWDMSAYLSQAISKYGLDKERVLMNLDCYYDEYNDKIVCEEPVGFFARIFSFL